MWIFHSGVTGYKIHRENNSHMGACNYRTEIVFFLPRPCCFQIIFSLLRFQRNFLHIIDIFREIFIEYFQILFLTATPMAPAYHLLPFITNPFRLISQRCFSIFEQSLHFTNFRLIISVSIIFFYFYFHLGVGIK